MEGERRLLNEIAKRDLPSRHTFHDNESIAILKATREAMVPTSQLLICETLIVPGADLKANKAIKYNVVAPDGVSLVSDAKPLPENLGRSLAAATMQDLLMFTWVVIDLGSSAPLLTGTLSPPFLPLSLPQVQQRSRAYPR